MSTVTLQSTKSGFGGGAKLCRFIAYGGQRAACGNCSSPSSMWPWLSSELVANAFAHWSWEVISFLFFSPPTLFGFFEIGYPRGPEKDLRSPETIVTGCYMWVLGTKPRPSARSESALNH